MCTKNTCGFPFTSRSTNSGYCTFIKTDTE